MQVADFDVVSHQQDSGETTESSPIVQHQYLFEMT